MNEFDLIELDTELTVQLTRKKVKRINLRIQRSGEIHISAPLKMPIALVYEFLHKQRSWIYKHQRRFQLMQATVDPIVKTIMPSI